MWAVILQSKLVILRGTLVRHLKLVMLKKPHRKQLQNKKIISGKAIKPCFAQILTNIKLFFSQVIDSFSLSCTESARAISNAQFAFKVIIV